MQVLAAIGDAPTAAIAVVAILLGLFFAARGPRDKRAAGAEGSGDERAPVMLSVPVARAPGPEPGFVGPEGEIVGHGLIRLGSVVPLGGGESPVAAPPPVAPEPAAPEPVAIEPAPAAEVALPAPEPADPSPEEPAGEREPAWRVAARAANPPAQFRQGTIKLGGTPVDKRKDP